MNDTIESLYKPYLRDLGKDALRNVRIGTAPGLSSAECFYINYYSERFRCKVPFHFTLGELNRVEGDFAEIFGRTPWGPWCRISLYRFSIFKVNVVRGEDPRVREIEERIC